MSEVTGETSDGYHTFNELYEHRHVLFAHLLQNSYMYDSQVFFWKTWRNQNGEVWDGWFIAGIDTEYGQISYHMPAEWWDRLPVVTEIERNENYDGHTSSDVLLRLKQLLGSAS
jgi:hypothetical protein